MSVYLPQEFALKWRAQIEGLQLILPWLSKNPSQAELSLDTLESPLGGGLATGHVPEREESITLGNSNDLECAMK